VLRRPMRESWPTVGAWKNARQNACFSFTVGLSTDQPWNNARACSGVAESAPNEFKSPNASRVRYAGVQRLGKILSFATRLEERAQPGLQEAKSIEVLCGGAILNGGHQARIESRPAPVRKGKRGCAASGWIEADARKTLPAIELMAPREEYFHLLLPDSELLASRLRDAGFAGKMIELPINPTYEGEGPQHHVTLLIPGRTPAIIFTLTWRMPRKSTPPRSGLYGTTNCGPLAIKVVLMALSEE
jgi:hypothetical protein